MSDEVQNGCVSSQLKALEEAWQILLAMLEEECGHHFDARRELLRLGVLQPSNDSENPTSVGAGPPMWEAYFNLKRIRTLAVELSEAAEKLCVRIGAEGEHGFDTHDLAVGVGEANSAFRKAAGLENS